MIYYDYVQTPQNSKTTNYLLGLSTVSAIIHFYRFSFSATKMDMDIFLCI